MPNPTYSVVYDVLRDGYDNAVLWALIAATLWCSGLWLIVSNRRSTSKDAQSETTLGWALLVLVPTFVVVGSAVEYGGDYDVRRRLARGEYAVVEGVVTDFVPGDPCCSRRRTPESFTVAGRRYVYEAGDLGGGYSRTAGQGGSMHSGQRVRITDVEGRIARLEFAP